MRSVIACSVLCGVILSSCSSPPDRSRPDETGLDGSPSPGSRDPGFDDTLLRNATYEIPMLATVLPGSAGHIRLREGFLEAVQAGSAVPVRVDYVDAASGDLDTDGRPDAAVVLAVQTGGSGTFYHLAAMLDRGGDLRQGGIASLGDRIQVHALSIQAGVILLDMTTHGPDDPMCCPTLRATARYLLRDGALVTP
jgi:hypothetical protein